MTNNSPDEKGWDACRPGTLVEYAHRTKRAHQRRLIARRVGEVAMALVLFMLAVRFIPPDDGEREYNYGGIICRDVQSEMPKYMMGEILPEQREMIRSHLAQCPRCQEMMKRMQKGNVALKREGRYPVAAANLGRQLSAGQHGIATTLSEDSEVNDHVFDLALSTYLARPE